MGAAVDRTEKADECLAGFRHWRFGHGSYLAALAAGHNLYPAESAWQHRQGPPKPEHDGLSSASARPRPGKDPSQCERWMEYCCHE